MTATKEEMNAAVQKTRRRFSKIGRVPGYDEAMSLCDCLDDALTLVKDAEDLAAVLEQGSKLIVAENKDLQTALDNAYRAACLDGKKSKAVSMGALQKVREILGPFALIDSYPDTEEETEAPTEAELPLPVIQTSEDARQDLGDITLPPDVEAEVEAKIEQAEKDLEEMKASTNKGTFGKWGDLFKGRGENV